MKKILVIEDNEQVRENLADLLDLSGYTVFKAPNGKIGVQVALSEHPDLILCDVMMPELDGFGVLHVLDKNRDTADIPFIFLTAKAEQTDFRKGMNLGADDYLTKPFDDVELLEAIERRLKKRERLQKSFDRTSTGLRAFIDEARGQRELEKLSKERKTKQYKKKESIFQEEDHALNLYFISSGKVKMVKTNEQGKEYITAIYQTGDFIGYRALIQEAPYTESAVAIETVELSIIPKADFLALLHNNRDFSIQFIKMLANNVDEKEEQLLNLAYHSIRKRVAEALMTLYQQNKTKPIKILRDDLASMVGTAKESVIRVLTDFKNEQLIAIESGAIIILEEKRLDRLPN
ncbi:MAG: response regulator [Bacteroidota bacterium]